MFPFKNFFTTTITVIVNNITITITNNIITNINMKLSVFIMDEKNIDNCEHT